MNVDYTLTLYGKKPQTSFNVFSYSEDKMGLYGLDITLDKNMEAHILITQPLHELDTPVEPALDQIINTIYSSALQQKTITHNTSVHWYFLRLDEVIAHKVSNNGVYLTKICHERLGGIWEVKDLLPMIIEEAPFDLADFVTAREELV